MQRRGGLWMDRLHANDLLAKNSRHFTNTAGFREHVLKNDEETEKQKRSMIGHGRQIRQLP